MGPEWTKLGSWAGARAGLFLFLMALSAPLSAARAEDRAQVFATAEQGYGRLVVSFPDRLDLPKYKITNNNGVLAILFDGPVNALVPDVSTTLDTYISVGRTDPDSKGIRFALKTPVNVNSMEAGEKLFIDLLPPTWQGLPPSLPPEVVAELAKRAEEAARLAEQKRKAAGVADLNPVPKLRIGENPTFVRLQFDWSVPTKAEFTQEGVHSHVTFEWPVGIDLTDFKAQLPAEVKTAENVVSADGSRIELTLADGVKPRFYKENDKEYFVDIDVASKPVSPLDAAALLEKEQKAALAASAQPVGKAVPASELADLTGTLTPIVNTVGSTVRVVFPFDEDTAAAVFRRGNTLWMVFDTLRGIGAPPHSPELDAIASGVTVVPAGDSQVVRIDLNADRLATLGSQGKAWVLSLGDVLLTPTQPLELSRRMDAEGLYQVTADLARPGQVHEFVDPVVGDTLEVVTAFPPARGVTRDLSFVDFATLRSVHGLVIRPTHKGVKVSLEAKLAVIHDAAGLTVSSVDSKRPALIGPEASREKFVDLEALREPDGVSFSNQQDRLMAKASAVEGEELDAARLQLAQFYLANQYGMEAIGVLSVLADNLKTPALKQKVQMAAAIADTEAHRPADALAILNGNSMSDDIDALMWRTIAKTEAQDYRGAKTDAQAAETAINKYPSWVQNRFLLSAIRSAIESGDMPLASRYLGLIDVARLSREETSLLNLLSARVDESEGRLQEALDGYGQVIAADFRPTRAEGIFRTLVILDKAGKLDIDKATSTLAAEAMLWRGGPLEANMQKLLAELYFRKGEYRLGFETAKQAALFHPESEPVSQLMGEAQTQFTDLYLNGTADRLEPVDALTLYYDFRELTPPGTRGDEMIRNLARRLVKVDLLQQAADLLQYQIDNRLQGVARAQVGADLAVINIANRNPQAALDVLDKTRLADVAPSLQRQRRTLEARAMIDAGRDDLALDMLSKLSGRDVDLLRVDAHWKAKRYSKAGELLEVLYPAPADGSQMSQEARMSIIKAAVGYVLAGDTLGVSRLRSKFGDALAKSPEWPMFDFVTSQMQKPTSAEFKQVAKQVAGLDSINAFLASYKDYYGVDGALTPTTANKEGAA